MRSKKRKYKKGFSRKDMLFNLKEYEKRQDDYDESVIGDPMFSYECGDMYLGDGMSCSPSTWAIMQGEIEHPNKCKCGSCEICEAYESLEMEIIREYIKEKTQ